MLEHATEEELLKEVGRRVEQEKIIWKITYLSGEDKTEMEFRAKEQKFSISFTVNTEIERNYFARQVYKQLEPRLIKAQQRRTEAGQKEQESKIYETLKLELENYKK